MVGSSNPEPEASTRPSGETANVVSPANDFAHLWPKKISFRTGGLITAQVAKGTRASGIPVERAPELPIFDWRQLQRWNIDEDRVEEIIGKSRVLEALCEDGGVGIEGDLRAIGLATEIVTATWLGNFFIIKGLQFRLALQHPSYELLAPPLDFGRRICERVAGLGSCSRRVNQAHG
jgi:hypothetical protein